MKTIKVVQVNEGIKSNSVPNRTRIGLKENGISVKILTTHSDVIDADIVVLKKSVFYKILRKLSCIRNHIEENIFYHKEKGMPFSYYCVGVNIAKEEIIHEADIIELHWICGSFISVRGLKKIVALKKPILWICHDNWPFTGGCHVRMGCDKYKKECGKCPLLHSRRMTDWSYRLLKAKKRVLKKGNITVISPSSWMDNNVAQSSLLSRFKHYVIPNPIDTNKYIPLEQKAIRSKYDLGSNDIVILFGAVNAASTPYKGYSYLLTALDMLEKRLDENVNVCAVVFGASDGEKRKDKKIKIKYLGYLNEDQMIEAYNLADVYVVPSLEDSFNNTVAEALSCTTPVVSFATGGITDIIDHKENGYLAKYKDAEDLARGIEWVLENNDNNILGIQGRKKVESNFSTSIVAKKYIEIYKMIM